MGAGADVDAAVAGAGDDGAAVAAADGSCELRPRLPWLDGVADSAVGLQPLLLPSKTTGEADCCAVAAGVEAVVAVAAGVVVVVEVGAGGVELVGDAIGDSLEFVGSLAVLTDVAAEVAAPTEAQIPTKIRTMIGPS